MVLLFKTKLRLAFSWLNCTMHVVFGRWRSEKFDLETYLLYCLITYVCTERIFGSRLLLYNKTFLEKLL